MKSLLTILLIIGFMSGAVIGILTMNQHGDCIMSNAAGMTCPQFNVLEYVGLHANFLRSFSSAFLVMILALSSLAIFISFVFIFNNFYLRKNFNRISFISENTSKRKQIHWLSLFETSPTTA